MTNEQDLVAAVEAATVALNDVSGREFDEQEHKRLKALGFAAHVRREMIVDRKVEMIEEKKYAEARLARFRAGNPSTLDQLP